jgi:hypothetical protein
MSPNASFDVERKVKPLSRLRIEAMSYSRKAAPSLAGAGLHRTGVAMLAVLLRYNQGELPVLKTQLFIAATGLPRGRKHDSKSRCVFVKEEVASGFSQCLSRG